MHLRRPSLLVALLSLVVVLGPTSTAPAVPADRPGAAGIGDAYFPLDGNGGIDVQSYDIHNRYRFRAGVLGGWTKLRLRATAAVSSFNLDFLLPVRRVWVDGKPVEFQQRPHELVIQRRLAMGEVVIVRVAYRGRPGPRVYAGERNWLAGRTEVVAMNQPHMAPWWFPANDHPLDKATMRISITVPAKYDVVANGHWVRRTVHKSKGPGKRPAKRWATTTWRAEEPMAPYLAFFAAGRYRIASGKQGGTPWLIAVSRNLPPAARDSAMTLMRRTPAVLGWLQRQLGPYPFSTTGGLTTSLPVTFALENQTRPTYPYLGRGPEAVRTVVHELAHQWFGDSVGLASWSDIWLSEGAATFFEWRWDESRATTTAARRLRSAYDRIAVGDPFWAGLVADPCATGQGCVNRIFATFVYERGAMTFQALRNRIGEDAFWTLLRRWVTERRGGHGTTAEFEALAEEVSNLDLDGFFDAWLRSGAKPADTVENGLG